MKIHYLLAEGATLEYALAIAKEIYAETGMIPSSIELDNGEQVAFSFTDLRRVEKGDMSGEVYADKHHIIQ